MLLCTKAYVFQLYCSSNAYTKRKQNFVPLIAEKHIHLGKLKDFVQRIAFKADLVAKKIILYIRGTSVFKKALFKKLFS